MICKVICHFEIKMGSTRLNWAQVGLSGANKGSMWTQLGSKGFKLTQVGSHRPKKKSRFFEKMRMSSEKNNLISWSELPSFKIP